MLNIYHKSLMLLVMSAAKLLDMALDGNMQALKELGDRLKGRPAQSLTNADGEAFVIQVKR